MRQVPKEPHFYTLIGGGRLASHLSYYFKLLEMPFNRWNRSPLEDLNSISTSEYPEAKIRLQESLKNSTHILLAISDSALPDFIKELQYYSDKKIIHFSGSYFNKEVTGAHPLMTFGPKLYDMDFYKKIPFVLDNNKNLTELFPKLENPYYNIEAEQKDLYHGYCVMSSNFPQIIWKNTLSQFEEKFNIPKKALYPILEKTLENAKIDFLNFLTGPLIRGDEPTIERNLTALEGQAEKELYSAFIKYYKQKNLGR